MIPLSLQHYLHKPLIKMGRWHLLPADTETWMTEETSDVFKDLFGLPKGILNICTLTDGFMQNYVPLQYARQLMTHIEERITQDPIWLTERLKTFYPLREEAHRQLIKTEDVAHLTNQALIEAYRLNRSWVHRLSAYDQFGWITETFWEPKLHDTLKHMGIHEQDPDFHRILFTLSKPEELSTTLQERLQFLTIAQMIYQGDITLPKGAITLQSLFGWMPVFTFGTPWTQEHYEKQLSLELERDPDVRIRDIATLNNYTAIREQERIDILRRFSIDEKDLGIFNDFSLMLDTRNEAEFFVSFAGFHLLSLYQEISKRLDLPLDEVRQLFESEIIDALEGSLDPRLCLAKKDGIVAWGFDPDMRTRINIDGETARELFTGVEQAHDKIEIATTQKGRCASPGLAKGQARILLSPKDNERVRPGDVLITIATTIDYLPAMQRASAIITEVGGLTCHAAVVARELGIPCIVSCPKATTHFSDGEWLEVNADKATISSHLLK